MGASPNYKRLDRPMGFTFIALCQLQTGALNFVDNVSVEIE